MSITPQFKDELRTRVTLSSLIQRTHALKKSGREWKACCPFHDEKTPSFTVNDQKGFYHCFGCGAHGDVISWMVDHENMGFIDAIKALCEIAGMDMPERDPKAAQREEYRSKLIGLNEAVSEYWHEALIGHEDTRKYLASRGIEAETIGKFRMGYASWTKDSALLAKWNQPKKLTQLGLIREREEGGHFDFFRKRVIIPIHDARGNVIAFGGRIVGKGDPKYLNSPDTPVFDKGKTLFNHHRAAPFARKNGRLIVVEGYMDVIALDFAGIPEVVAPNGTAMTEYQLRMCWQINPKPILVFDGDNAGRRAAIRAAERALPLLEPGKTLSFAFPPDGLDPDDLSREKGRDAVETMLSEAISVPQLLWNDLIDRFDTQNADQRAELTGEVRNIVGRLRNRDVYSAYREEFWNLMKPRQHGRSNSTGRVRNQGDSPMQAMAVSLFIALLDRPSVLFKHYESILKLTSGDEMLMELMEASLDIICDGQETPEGFVDAMKRQGFEGQMLALRQRQTLRLNVNSDEQLFELLKAAYLERHQK